jgi:hypothetical protein
MTKKESIKELEKQNVGDNEEIMISIVSQSDPGGIPSLIPIDYIGGQFINITLEIGES